MHVETLALLTLCFIADAFSLCPGKYKKGDLHDHPNYKLLPAGAECGKGGEGSLSPEIRSRIVKGHKAKPHQFPWLALIYSIPDITDPTTIFPFCGGSVINQRYVISAAHCVHPALTPWVRLGEHDLSLKVNCSAPGSGNCARRAQDFEVESTTVHPEYILKDDNTIVNDISLFRLKEKITLNRYIQPICLPMDRSVGFESSLSEERLQVAGWGDTSQENGEEITADVLQTATLQYVPRQLCERDLKEELEVPVHMNSTMICAKGREGQGTCSGDSGGPLMGWLTPDQSHPRYFLLGVVSFGSFTCGKIGVYSNVAEFMCWVLDNIY